MIDNLSEQAATFVPTPANANGWGGPCHKCGHPASYHGMTFCQTEAGSTRKKPCDCDGYSPGSLTTDTAPLGTVESIKGDSDG